MDFNTIQDEALGLSPDDRAKLSERLLLSLDSLSEEEMNDSWLIEAERRAREMDRGEIQPVPADEVLKKARALLR